MWWYGQPLDLWQVKQVAVVLRKSFIYGEALIDQCCPGSCSKRAGDTGYKLIKSIKWHIHTLFEVEKLQLHELSQTCHEGSHDIRHI